MDESQVIHLKSSVIDAFSLPPIGGVPKQQVVIEEELNTSRLAAQIPDDYNPDEEETI